jgi:hyperosmotically inducible protein
MNLKLAIAIPSLLLVSQATLGQDENAGASFRGEVRDAWITGKLEMAYTLNEHLNPFAIDSDVDGGMVTLTGMVESDIDRDLAAEIAKSVDGVVRVSNELTLGMPKAEQGGVAAEREGRNFPTWFDDATTTAAVKTRLIRNANTQGLEIDVDTNEDVVTLSGSVDSNEQKDLAGEIAGNTGDVKGVRNLLVVAGS